MFIMEKNPLIMRNIKIENDNNLGKYQRIKNKHKHVAFDKKYLT